MVVEDADVFLTSRERDHNDMMARFLNVSGGLYKTGRVKKLIFTGNLAQASQIDQALLREGRCFDCLMFRPLRFEEAVQAAQVAEVGATGLHAGAAFRAETAPENRADRVLTKRP